MNWPWMARNGLNPNLITAWNVRSVLIFTGRPPIPRMHIGIIFQRLLRILLVIRFQDQDHTWWKDLTFSSEMFLEIGYWSKVFDWQFFFISKQLLVQSLHDQDHIWWKVSNFSSEMFLEIGYWSKMFDWQFSLSQNNFLYKVFMIKIKSDEKFQTFLRRCS